MGLSYLWGLHLNDAHKHENIRLGFLSLTFHVVLTDPCMSDRPLILGMLAYGSETDSDGVWAAEVM
ncbi:hypothetical protein EDD17DRAFT_1602086, partial [Pisolithus thermaeus]